MTDRALLSAWEAEVVLRDGTALRVRTARPQDEDALISFYRGLSEQSLVYRFFTRISNSALVEQIRRLLYPGVRGFRAAHQPPDAGGLPGVRVPRRSTRGAG